MAEQSRENAERLVRESVVKITGISAEAMTAMPLDDVRSLAQRLLSHSFDPEWRKKEIIAESVNCLPAINGFLIWKCEHCGKEWKEQIDRDPSYDRTKDHSNWTVVCADCSKPTAEHVEGIREGMPSRKSKPLPKLASASRTPPSLRNRLNRIR
jgi:hypothetical protein